MSTFKLNRAEFDFVLRFLPAFKDVSTKEQSLYAGLFEKLSKAPKAAISKFRFTIALNASAKVSCIKFIRERTGWGLKEAKDAFDAETIFSLNDWKMSREQLEELLKKSNSYYNTDSWGGSTTSGIKIEWVD